MEVVLHQPGKCVIPRHNCPSQYGEVAANYLYYIYIFISNFRFRLYTFLCKFRFRIPFSTHYLICDIIFRSIFIVLFSEFNHWTILCSTILYPYLAIKRIYILQMYKIRIHVSFRLGVSSLSLVYWAFLQQKQVMRLCMHLINCIQVQLDPKYLITETRVSQVSFLYQIGDLCSAV